MEYRVTEQPWAPDDPFGTWVAALEHRHLDDLTFQEVRRGVQALSAAYVEKRGGHVRDALAGAGKRAAFALFYAPLHFLTVRAIVRRCGAALLPVTAIHDLGCGSGAAGAAWALEMHPRPALTGIEKNSWAAAETRWTYRTMRLAGKVRTADLIRTPIGGTRGGVVAAFTLNELDQGKREAVRDKLVGAWRQGASILVVEPIARRISPWWSEWIEKLVSLGARDEQYRVAVTLPPTLRLLDKAAQLDHRELTARSLWLPAGGSSP